MENKYLKEACVESLEEARNAHKQGAHLLEVCSNLAQDGLTPSLDLVKKIQSELDLHLKIMIRPTHVYQSDEKILPQILSEIDEFKALGISEVVVGYLRDNRLDMPFIKKIAEAAYPMTITIHKAIDKSENIKADIEALKQIPNITSILSSGAAPTAQAGINTLLKMKKWCGDRINLIAAGKVTYTNVDALHKELGLGHYHGRRIVG